MKFRDLIGKDLLFFDGAMGTILQEKGMKTGELTENMNIDRPDLVREVHEDYLRAGANVIYSNSFGANRIKFENNKYGVGEVIKAGVKVAGEAISKVGGENHLLALGIGPSGKLLKPIGDLDFEEAVSIFKEMVEAGVSEGVDLIVIETMSDTYELKAAVLAAKEVTDLPIVATVAFSDDLRLLNGADPKTVIALLEGLGVDCLGINCGIDPRRMKGIVEEFVQYSSLPILLKPNAGMPKKVDGKVFFDLEADDFADLMSEFLDMGVHALGGCCGSSPDHIERLVNKCKGRPIKPPTNKGYTFISSYSRCLGYEDRPVVVGERINPTGKKLLKKALIDGDYTYVLKEAISQEDHGAEILDLNVGLNEIDEVKVMLRAMESIQEITRLPLQIDTSKPEVMEAALRRYNGKAMLNSVNGKEESMKAIFPLVKKYGAVVVALALDDEGIPETAEGRYRVAEKIIKRAADYGIDKKDIVVDALTMTVGTDRNAGKETLKALHMIKTGLGVKTTLGVSNVSFGLPQREIINRTFFTGALYAGLDFAIINPLSKDMMKAYDSYILLSGRDENSAKYIEKYSAIEEELKVVVKEEMELSQAIKKGLKEDSYRIAQMMLADNEALDIINAHLVPALDEVGNGFEKGTIFLPQLMMSADAASAAFEALKDKLPTSKEGDANKEKIVIATVKGDVHDIGKNIVKVLLENYGFDVIDLGKDVDYEIVLESVRENKAKLLGLSALMTTTVENMERTIELVKEEFPELPIMIGGAVLTADYSKTIGADRYCKDAMDSVRYAKEIIG
ncbi:MAG: dihydropteroate synthase [Tissierellia bacterium]|nr:dihydropteroate synthase [Tissierellia bacterium]